MKASEILDSKIARVRHVLEDTAEKSSIKFNESIRQAVELIATRPNSALAVVDANSDLIGIVTEKDIIGAVQKDGVDSLNKSVDSIMTKNPVTAQTEDSCRDKLVLMIDGNFRNMPVFDDKKFAGILQIVEASEGKLSELISENRKLLMLVDRLVPNEFTFSDDATSVDIQKCLEDNNLPCVPIRGQDGIIGVIADYDVCKANVEELSETLE